MFDYIREDYIREGSNFRLTREVRNQLHLGFRPQFFARHSTEETTGQLWTLTVGKLQLPRLQHQQLSVVPLLLPLLRWHPPLRQLPSLLVLRQQMPGFIPLLSTMKLTRLSRITKEMSNTSTAVRSTLATSAMTTALPNGGWLLPTPTVAAPPNEDSGTPRLLPHETA